MEQRLAPDSERSAFIKAYPHLDLTEVPDAWGRPMFKHTHVQALWDGWFARACLRTPEWLAGEKRIHDRERPSHYVHEMHKGGEP